MPTISIIVPVYKVEPYLRRCVDSILGQTYADFELILVDDGSPDNCGSICDEYAKKDSRVVVIHQKNGGLSAARNAGIDWAFANSNSQWFTFIDSDDWVNQVYLQALYEAAVNENCLITACDFIVTNRVNNAIITEPTSSRSITTPSFYNTSFYNAQSACCKLFNKALFDSPGCRFPKGILYEDSALIYQILFSQERIAFTDDAVYYYFRREESITNAAWNPRKMVYCQVQRDQLQWLIDHNYDECIKTCLCRYLSTLHYNISLIQQIPEYQKYTRTMRKICREMLRKYGKQYTLTIEEYPSFYQAAYPHATQIYWVAKAQINKLNGRRKGD